MTAAHTERVWGPQMGGKHVDWWYPVRKDSGNIYLDMDVTIGSKVSGIRDGTATGSPF